MLRSTQFYTKKDEGKSASCKSVKEERSLNGIFHSVKPLYLNAEKSQTQEILVPLKSRGNSFHQIKGSQRSIFFLKLRGNRVVLKVRTLTHPFLINWIEPEDFPLVRRERILSDPFQNEGKKYSKKKLYEKIYINLCCDEWRYAQDGYCFLLSFLAWFGDMLEILYKNLCRS